MDEEQKRRLRSSPYYRAAVEHPDLNTWLALSPVSNSFDSLLRDLEAAGVSTQGIASLISGNLTDAVLGNDDFRLATMSLGELVTEMADAEALARLDLAEKNAASRPIKLQEVILPPVVTDLHSATSAKVRPAMPAAKAPRVRKTPHENPDSLLKDRTQVTRAQAGVILGLSDRWIRNLIDERKLEERGEGHRKMITVASLRKQIKSSRKTE